MGFRFRRSMKLVPGIRLNLSKTGTSVSVGGRGATMNISPKGIRTTLGIPGTGLSYVSQTSYHGKGAGAGSNSPTAGILPQRVQHHAKWRKVKGLCAVLCVIAITIFFASKGNHTGSQEANTPASPLSASPPYTTPATSVPTPSTFPAAPGASTQPSSQSSTGSDAATPAADAGVNAATLAATMERLRAEQRRAQASHQSSPPQQSLKAPLDQAQAPPQPASASTNQVWPNVTSSGTRWRSRP